MTSSWISVALNAVTGVLVRDRRGDTDTEGKPWEDTSYQHPVLERHPQLMTFPSLSPVMLQVQPQKNQESCQRALPSTHT